MAVRIGGQAVIEGVMMKNMDVMQYPCESPMAR